MGTASSRQFRHALQKGDEEAALALYLSREDLRPLNPSKLVGIVRRTSPMHYAAKRGFARLFREFMLRGGDPNAENYARQSVVHEICTAPNGSEASVGKNRADVLEFLITFCAAPTQPSPSPQPGERSRVEELAELAISVEEAEGVPEEPRSKPQPLLLSKQDSALNTPLHLAATSGLSRCVELLLAYGAATNTENIAKQTPLDCAEASGHADIVALLEPKVVFSPSQSSRLLKLKQPFLQQESYLGVTEQELQETKDHLTLQMYALLGVPMTTATALLQAHGWSKELLVQAWFQDSQAACDRAKVRLPFTHQTSLLDGVARQLSVEERECEICTETIAELTTVPCSHSFCKECWRAYLELKISEGRVAQLLCPGADCNQRVPADIVSSLVPKEVDAKYLKFGIDTFVEVSAGLKWCPHPGCSRAVQLPDSAPTVIEEETDGATGVAPTDEEQVGVAEEAIPRAAKEAIPRAVDCGLGHFFCWACGAEPHDPCSCELWRQWKEEVTEKEGEATNTSKQATSDAWVAKHSKPCPNCLVPIQRSDGCNHMTCSKCSHDFCWVCLGKWSIHGSSTGGYFDCYRYQSARNVEKRLNLTRDAAAERAKRTKSKMVSVIRSRYLNHLESLRFEEPLLERVKEKAEALIKAARESSANIKEDSIDTGFVRDGVRELLKARRVLCGSYALSYFIPNRKSQEHLIKLLAPLEKSTEVLAEMITRDRLRTPRDKIVLATVESREIRRRYLPKARKLSPTVTLESTPLELEDESEDPISAGSDEDSDYPSDTSDENDEEEDYNSDNSFGFQRERRIGGVRDILRIISTTESLGLDLDLDLDSD